MELKTFVKTVWVSTDRIMAMPRQKKLGIRWMSSSWRGRNQPEFHFSEARTAGKTIFETTYRSDYLYDEPLSRSTNVRMERGEKIVLYGANRNRRRRLVKSIRDR